jgi:hypothetical protein
MYGMPYSESGANGVDRGPRLVAVIRSDNGAGVRQDDATSIG